MPNGKKLAVNNENKDEYLNALAQYRLFTRVKREIESFLKGLSEIVPDGLLSNFDENELEVSIPFLFMSSLCSICWFFKGSCLNLPVYRCRSCYVGKAFLM